MALRRWGRGHHGGGADFSKRYKALNKAKNDQFIPRGGGKKHLRATWSKGKRRKKLQEEGENTKRGITGSIERALPVHGKMGVTKGRKAIIFVWPCTPPHGNKGASRPKTSKRHCQLGEGFKKPELWPMRHRLTLRKEEKSPAGDQGEKIS